MLKTYYPEMGEKKPTAFIEAQLSHGGTHWYLTTRFELKGQGIRYLKTYGDDNTYSNRLVGFHEYKVTQRAFNKIKTLYDVVQQRLLD